MCINIFSYWRTSTGNKIFIIFLSIVQICILVLFSHIDAQIINYINIKIL